MRVRFYVPTFHGGREVPEATWKRLEAMLWALGSDRLVLWGRGGQRLVEWNRSGGVLAEAEPAELAKMEPEPVVVLEAHLSRAPEPDRLDAVSRFIQETWGLASVPHVVLDDPDCTT